MDDETIFDQLNRIHDRIDQIPRDLSAQFTDRIGTQVAHCGTVMERLIKNDDDKEQRLRKVEAVSMHVGAGSSKIPNGNKRHVVMVLPEKIPTKGIIAVVLAVGIAASLLVLAFTAPDQAGEIISSGIPSPPGM